MTLVVFLPILFALSSYVSELPIIGDCRMQLFWLAIVWSIFGTVLLATVGIKLPGLNFRNQRVEAAYRKELVITARITPTGPAADSEGALFQCAKNYFRMYWHYLYFNVAAGISTFRPMLCSCS